MLIKKFGFWWWLIVLFLLGGIILIVYNLTHTYEFKKPEGIRHYEGIRDNLTINKDLNITEVNLTQPCTCDNGSIGTMQEQNSGFSNSNKSLFGVVQIIVVVGIIFVLLSVFGISGDIDTSSWNKHKKGASMIAGIISLVIVVIVFTNVVIPAIQSVNTSILMCVCP